MERDLTETIVAAAVEVHRCLGAGLLENVYESALCHELAAQYGLLCQRQVPIPVLYKGVPVRAPLFLDVLVERQVVIEIKSAEKNYPYYQMQLFTHLRFLGLKIGLLINFGKESLNDGISRIVNDPIAARG
ncbi:MAG: GxxExxY protein [Chlamydiia bacterium]|nr:GxxExxY protein [Chlamydiia bacterium]